MVWFLLAVSIPPLHPCNTHSFCQTKHPLSPGLCIIQVKSIALDLGTAGGGWTGCKETLMASALCSGSVFLFKDAMGRKSCGSSPIGSQTLYAAQLAILLLTTRAFNSTGNLLKYKSVFAMELSLTFSGGSVWGGGMGGFGFVHV